MRRGPSVLDVAIVGGGMAGLAAAQQCALRGFRTVLFEAELCGGMLINVGEVHGYPAPEVFSGAEIASALQAQNTTLGVRTLPAAVEAIVPGAKDWTVSAGDERLRARAVVAATGSAPAPLTVPGFERLWAKGVSQCAYCDGGLYRGEPVVVVGGGNGALQEALHLASLASEVVIVHRRNRLGARQHYVSEAAERPNIQFRWSHEVVEILGADAVEGVRIRQVERGDEAIVASRAVFPFVGGQARTALFAEHAALDAEGRLRVDVRLMTGAPGLYAAGAVRAGYAGALVDAVSDAATIARAIAGGD